MRQEQFLENESYTGKGGYNESHNFYDEGYLEESVENDSISQEEEAFMRGYMEDF